MKDVTGKTGGGKKPILVKRSPNLSLRTNCFRHLRKTLSKEIHTNPFKLEGKLIRKTPPWRWISQSPRTGGNSLGKSLKELPNKKGGFPGKNFVAPKTPLGGTPGRKYRGHIFPSAQKKNAPGKKKSAGAPKKRLKSPHEGAYTHTTVYSANI